MQAEMQAKLDVATHILKDDIGVQRNMEFRCHIPKDDSVELGVQRNMNIQGLFQFMSSEQGNSFFCDVTPENSTDFLEQLMQNPEFLAQTQVFVDDVSVLRQKVVTKIGQMCKKMKKTKDEPVDTVPLPVMESTKPRIVDGYELDRRDADNVVETSINVQYAIDDAAYQKENVVDRDEPIDESLGTHIGEGIYLQREGHVFKMTTPQFVVYY
jgi:hypothetical protein